MRESRLSDLLKVVQPVGDGTMMDPQVCLTPPQSFLLHPSVSLHMTEAGVPLPTQISRAWSEASIGGPFILSPLTPAALQSALNMAGLCKCVLFC